MNNKQKLELTWIGKDCRLTLQSCFLSIAVGTVLACEWELL